MTSTVTKVTGGKWVRTRRCGCGECNTRSGTCPMEDDPKAVWLWGTEYTPGEDEVPTLDADGVEIDSWD